MTDTQAFDCFAQILKDELIPVMGCTEPIAIAYTAAVAAETLGEPFTQIRVGCSINIFKNAKSVSIPNTAGLIGIEAAALTGAIAGVASKSLAVIEAVSPAQNEAIRAALKAKLRTAYIIDSEHLLQVIVEMHGQAHSCRVELRDAHNRIVSIVRDGHTLSQAADRVSQNGHSCAEEHPLTVASIKAFADEVPIAMIVPVLSAQIKNNYAIAVEGMQNDYGVNYGRLVLDGSDSVYQKMVAYTVAASEARMAGCSLPVTINSGSGNQGIASSVPAIIYCREKGLPDEKLYRALAFANLLTIYQKTYIGKLSGFCGAISAACSSGAALTYLEGGSLEQIKNSITNTLAVTPGIFCDGAKISCGAKLAAGLQAAIHAHKLAMRNSAYHAGEGILCADADETIRAIGHIAREGMRQTDKEIIQVMFNNC